MEPVGERIRVVLVDDEHLVRTGLRLILDGDPLIQIVGEAGDGEAAVRLVAELDPDLVLMDVRMPRMDGLAATRQLLEGNPALKILVLTTFDTDELVLQALEVGASGFLLKDTPPPALIEAVHQVARGQRSLSPAALDHLVAAATSTRGHASARTAALERLARLTDRERAIASAVGRGLSNTEIADTLQIGITTVKTHLGRILDKLDVGNRVHLALLVHDAESGEHRH